jgi:hypothetical protein
MIRRLGSAVLSGVAFGLVCITVPCFVAILLVLLAVLWAVEAAIWIGLFVGDAFLDGWDAIGRRLRAWSILPPDGP